MGLTHTISFLKNPVLLLTVSAFGFYVRPLGIRTEQVLTYVFFLFVLFNALGGKPLIIPHYSKRALLLFCGFLLYAGLLWITASKLSGSRYVYGQIDRFVLPVAVIIVISYFLKSHSSGQLKSLLGKVAETILVLCGIAAILAFIHLLTGEDSFVKPFLPVGGDRGTVASRSFNMGRYTGIFNSPFDNGIVNSLAFFCFIYLLETGKVKKRHVFFLILSVFGSLLAVSKAGLLGFFLGGIILLRQVKANKFRLVFLIIAFLLGGFLFSSMVAPKWGGYNSLINLLQVDTASDTDFIRLYTAGRFTRSGEGTIQGRYDQLAETMPWGRGFGDYGVVDNAFLEVAHIAGIIGLSFLVLFFRYYVRLGVRFKKYPEGQLLFIIILYSAIASLGAPVITKNRFSVLFFIVLSIISLILKQIYYSDQYSAECANKEKD